MKEWEEILNKWELKLNSETITITEERENYFTIHTDNFTDDVTNSLWFPSYRSARKYVREGMYVEGRFKKTIT